MLCIRKTVAPNSIARLFVCACVYTYDHQNNKIFLTLSFSLYLVLKQLISRNRRRDEVPNGARMAKSFQEAFNIYYTENTKLLVLFGNV